MKVAKKVRLLTKDNSKERNFVKNDNYEVLRNRAVVEDSVVAESEAMYKETGVLYIVDEKATKERNDLKNPKKATKDIEVKSETVKTDKK